MIGLSVKSNARSIIAEIDGLTAGGARTAMMRALNRAAGGVRTDASREIRKTYKVKKATVDKSFSVQTATSQSLRAVVHVSGRPLSLAGFAARQTKKGVTVNVKGQRKLIRHAFIRTLKTQRGEEFDVVFIREGKSRLPIKALKTVNVTGLFTIEEIQRVIDASTTQRFEVELVRNIKFLLKS